jgi:NTE family protein
VLGGGGARGSAHIGVIRLLEELSVPVDYVGGTSMGSLVAGLYATGLSADELEDVILEIDWDDLFTDATARRDQPFRRKRDDNLALFGPKLGIGRDASLIPSGAVSGQKISFLFERLVRERVQVNDFDALPIPYRAVAADIATGEQVVLASGDLAVAMRASMSVPGIFDPVALGEHLLVDGGIVNNVPVDVVRAMGAERVIAVDVGASLTSRDDLKDALAIVNQLSSLLIKYNVDRQLASLAPEDVLINPQLDGVLTSAEFDKSAAGIAAGYEAASGLRQQLARFSLSDADYRAYRGALAACVTPMPAVDFVRLDNRSRFNDDVIERLITIAPGAPLEVSELESNLSQIHALGFIELARYEVVQEGAETGVVIKVDQDPRGTQMLEWGVDYDGDGDASALNLRLGYLNSGLDEYGSELRVVAQVGEDPGLVANYYKYLEPRLQIFAEPRVFAERRRFLAYEDGEAVLEARVSQYGGSLNLGREIGRVAAVAAGIRLFSGEVGTAIGQDATGGDLSFDGGEYRLEAVYDRLDNRYFPGDGALLDALYRNASSDLGADDGYRQVLIDGLVARSYGRHTIMAGARYYETLNDEAPIYAQFRAGGFARLSGLQDQEVVGNNFAMLLGGYRYRFGGSGLLPAYLGGTVEYGGVADEIADIADDGSLNGSLYLGFDSPVGPIYIGGGFAEDNQQRFFVRIGNVFGPSTLSR